MTFDEVLDQIRELLRQRGRVTYRSLKLRYQLDDELLAGVTDELISAERVAVDEDGKVLVWIGPGLVSGTASQAPRAPSENEPPVSRPQAPDARPTAGERRQLTVMFIDLVGSTTPPGQDRRVTQGRDLTSENDSAIAPIREGGRDGSRVCAGDLEPCTVGRSRAEFMAVGSGSVILALGVYPASGAGVREGD